MCYCSIALQGGNYITTDIINRAEFRTSQRYWDEVRRASEFGSAFSWCLYVDFVMLPQVRMHREMGMNVIRLWGGNGGAAQGLWDAADEQVGVS